MKKTVQIIALALSIAAAFLSAGCGETRTDGENTTEAEMNDTTTEQIEEQYPFDFTFEGSAGYKDGKVSAGSKQSVKNAASFVPDGDVYRLSLSVIAEPGQTGAVFFLASGRDDGFRLSLSPRKHKATLGLLKNGDIAQSLTNACEIAEGVPYLVTIDVTAESVRIMLGESPDDSDSLRFEVLRDGGDGREVILDCGSMCDTSFSDISVGTLPSAEGKYFENPILGKNAESADPFILCDDGKYYIYSTNAPMQGYRVSVSEDLLSWTDLGFCLESSDVFGEPTSTAGFWAPEVYAIGSGEGKKYALLYTVNEHVGVAFADSPAGPFKSLKDSFLVTDSHAIDPTLFRDDDGKTYLFYVGFGEKQYGIYGCEVDIENCVCGPAKLIISPASGTWETKQGSVTEGPFILKHDGTYYLTYSGNGYTSHYYALGYATSDSPLGDYVRYSGNPFLAQNPRSGVYGPGHHAFFYTPDGHLMIVYHRHYSKDSVWPRVACIDRVLFLSVGDGPDLLTVAGPTVTRQILPE